MSDLVITDKDKVEPTHVVVFAYAGMAQTFAFAIDKETPEVVAIEDILTTIQRRQPVRLTDGVSKFCFVPPLDSGVSVRVLTTQAYHKEQIDMQYAQAQAAWRGGRH